MSEFGDVDYKRGILEGMDKSQMSPEALKAAYRKSREHAVRTSTKPNYDREFDQDYRNLDNDPYIARTKRRMGLEVHPDGQPLDNIPDDDDSYWDVTPEQYRKAGLPYVPDSTQKDSKLREQDGSFDIP